MELERDPAARALIESTVEMAQRLGLKVTAEGVETDSTFAQLRLIGCDDAQGWFISKSFLPTRFRPSSLGGRKRAAHPETAILVLPRSSRPFKTCSTKPRCRATPTRL